MEATGRAGRRAGARARSTEGTATGWVATASGAASAGAAGARQRLREVRASRRSSRRQRRARPGRRAARVLVGVLRRRALRRTAARGRQRGHEGQAGQHGGERPERASHRLHGSTAPRRGQAEGLPRLPRRRGAFFVRRLSRSASSAACARVRGSRSQASSRSSRRYAVASSRARASVSGWSITRTRGVEEVLRALRPGASAAAARSRSTTLSEPPPMSRGSARSQAIGTSGGRTSNGIPSISPFRQLNPPSRMSPRRSRVSIPAFSKPLPGHGKGRAADEVEVVRGADVAVDAHREPPDENALVRPEEARRGARRPPPGRAATTGGAHAPRLARASESRVSDAKSKSAATRSALACAGPSARWRRPRSGGRSPSGDARERHGLRFGLPDSRDRELVVRAGPPAARSPRDHRPLAHQPGLLQGLQGRVDRARRQRSSPSGGGADTPHQQAAVPRVPGAGPAGSRCGR